MLVFSLLVIGLFNAISYEQSALEYHPLVVTRASLEPENVYF